MPLSSRTPDQQTNSFVCLQEELTNPRGRSRSQTYPTPQDAVGVTRPTRFRRSSFALSGERQTALDNLVDSASLEATIAAATQEAAALSALVSPHPESAMLAHDDKCLDSKRVSVSTIVAGQSGSSTLFHPAGPVDKSGRPSVHYPPGRNVTVCELSTENDNLSPWHDSGCPHSSLLNSEVIQNYLASLVVDSDVEECEKSPKLSTIPVTMTCENVPGLFRESVASMTMPVHQIRRAHLTAIPQRVTDHLRRNRPVGSMRYDLPHFPTDFTSSSCASDAEGWPSIRGYMSDNPIDEADPRAKQLRLTGQRLEADFHRTKSLPRSPKTKRMSSSNCASIAEALVGYGNAPTSHVSNFDLSHVYDGLPSPKAVLSTNSLNFETFRSTLTPPSTPASSRSASSMDPDSGGSVNNGFGRIISLFGPFKPKPPNDNPESYIYMDEETSERRARARASNVISPVSF